MKITLENTDKVVALEIDGAVVPTRIWQGRTESGIPVHCFVTRIVPEVPLDDPRIDELSAEFERELSRTAAPRQPARAIPQRLVL